MTKPCLSIVVAASDNHVIGNQGNLPWRMPADLQHFKKLTMGHVLIMGRKTYDSIGKPLPGRTTIVLSRNTEKSSLPSEVYLAKSLEEAIEIANNLTTMDHEEIFITGGGEIYQLTLPVAKRIHLTRVHTKVEGDAFFPEIDLSIWNQESSDFLQATEKNQHDCSFELYERRIN